MEGGREDRGGLPKGVAMTKTPLHGPESTHLRASGQASGNPLTACGVHCRNIGLGGVARLRATRRYVGRDRCAPRRQRDLSGRGQRHQDRRQGLHEEVTVSRDEIQPPPTLPTSARR